MKIAFVELEPSDGLVFREELADHDLQFAYDLSEVDKDAEIVSPFIYSQIDAAFLQEHPNLRLIATRSTTYDQIDLEACDHFGVTVCCVPSYGDATVAEHVFALLLALTRRLRENMEVSTRFSYETTRGTELRSKTFGIIGAGREGQHTVPIAHGFGMEVLAYDVHADQAAARTLGFRYVPITELLSRSDVISLHANMSPSTHHMLGAAEFKQCKPGVLIINTARGALIDTDALVDAMNAGIVAGVGLDVLEEESVLRREALHVISDQILQRVQTHPTQPGAGERAHDMARVRQLHEIVRNRTLLSRKNVVCTPHVAFNTKEAVARIN